MTAETIKLLGRAGCARPRRRAARPDGERHRRRSARRVAGVGARGAAAGDRQSGGRARRRSRRRRRAKPPKSSNSSSRCSQDEDLCRPRLRRDRPRLAGGALLGARARRADCGLCRGGGRLLSGPAPPTWSISATGFSRALAGDGEAAVALPDEAILVAEDLAPSRFLEIDWTRSAGVALTRGSASSHVAMLARVSRRADGGRASARFPPATGRGSCSTANRARSRSILRRRGSPNGAARRRRSPSSARKRSRLANAPAVTRSGREFSPSSTFRA